MAYFVASFGIIFVWLVVWFAADIWDGFVGVFVVLGDLWRKVRP